MKFNNENLFLILSALCFILPFWLSSIFWWLIFFSFVPLFYSALHPASRDKVSFWHGYAWGFLVFFLHVSGFVQSLFSMTQGSFFLLALIIVGVIAYLAVYTGLWFLVTDFLLQFFSVNHSVIVLSIWILTATVYIWCIDTVCLWPFLRIEGYPFIHPLLPLATHPQLLWIMPYSGKTALTLLLIITNASIATWLHIRRIRSFVITTISFLPWIVFFYTAPPPQNPPAWLCKIVPLQIQFPPQSKTIFPSLYYECVYKYQQYPDAQLIVLPESALYQPIDTTFTDLIDIQLPDLLIGSLCINKKHTYNTLYWIKKGKIIHKFCKRHTLFFTEQLPWWCNNGACNSLLFSESSQRSCSHNQRPLLTISSDIFVVPYICSELFFNRYPDDNYVQFTILALCNDWWYSVNYPRQLMLLVAQLKALEWKRPIIYISYFYTYFIDAQGNIKKWL